MGYHVPMALTPVQSSFISAIGYDLPKRQLTVQHTDGSVYHYHNVGPAVHEALMESESKGRFINIRIKGYYRESLTRYWSNIEAPHGNVLNMPGAM